jgi:hypothetical protein
LEKPSGKNSRREREGKRKKTERSYKEELQSGKTKRTAKRNFRYENETKIKVQLHG